MSDQRLCPVGDGRERESERERERERRYSSKRSSIIGSRWYVPGNGGGGSGGEGWGGFFFMKVQRECGGGWSGRGWNGGGRGMGPGGEEQESVRCADEARYIVVLCLSLSLSLSLCLSLSSELWARVSFLLLRPY